MEKKYISVVKDRDNRNWIFEGKVQGKPIWIEEKHAKPLLMTEEESFQVAKEILQPEETIIIRKVRQ
jgi:hypothetical protein